MVSEVATVPVEGGLLTYEVLAGATEPVLAIHGVSSQRRLWNWQHFQAPELTLVAPDRRGCGDSVTITGQFSLAQHVTDMIILLDRLGIESIHLCGHVHAWFRVGRTRRKMGYGRQADGPGLGR